MVNTDTVPSARLATSARLPCRLMESPAGPLPASKVAMTCGGEAFRSMTETRLSGICFLGSLGSIFMAAVTRARLSSGVMATLRGGPTTLVGAVISATSLGGYCFMSITDTVSTAGFCTTVLTPSISTTLLSLAERASCASTVTADARSVSPSSGSSTRRFIAASLRAGMDRPILVDLPAAGQGGYHRGHGCPRGSTPTGTTCTTRRGRRDPSASPSTTGKRSSRCRRWTVTIISSTWAPARESSPA